MAHRGFTPRPFTQHDLGLSSPLLWAPAESNVKPTTDGACMPIHHPRGSIRKGGTNTFSRLGAAVGRSNR